LSKPGAGNNRLFCTGHSPHRLSLYTAVEEIRALKASIRRELLCKGIESNINLGPGGICEIEFVGRAFQLIRGGRDASRPAFPWPAAIPSIR